MDASSPIGVVRLSHVGLLPLPGRIQLLGAEFVRGLGVVHGGLEDYLETDGEDPRPLQAAAAELRLIAGAAVVAGASGPAVLAQEMGETLGYLLAGKAASRRDEVLASLAYATLLLRGDIDALAAGEPDRTLVLLPVVNELRAGRGAAPLDRPGLCARQLAMTLRTWAASEWGRMDPGAGPGVQSLAKAELAAYQGAFLDWFKGHEPVDALRRMQDIAARVEAAARDRSGKALWRVLGWLLGSLAAGAGEAPSQIKRLLGRSGVELQRLARGEDVQDRDAWELAAQAGCWLVEAPQVPPAAERWIDALGLHALMPDEAALTAARRRLEAPALDVRTQLYAELSRDLQGASDRIDLVVRTRGRTAGRMDEVAAVLTRTAETLTLLGLPQLRAILERQAERVTALVPDVADGWSETADALLQVETALHEALVGPSIARTGIAGALPSAGLDAWLAAARLRTCTAVLAREALVNMADLETALAAGVAEDDEGYLGDLPKRVALVAAALRVGGVDAVASPLEAVGRYIESGRALGRTSDSALVEPLSEAFVMVRICLEALRDGWTGGDRLHEALAEVVASLPARRAAGEPERVAAAEPMTAEPAPSAPVVADADDAPDAAAAEIRAVFIEEAREVADDLNRRFPQLQRDAHDRDTLAQVRRAFHTLKGSGRMVGADGIGEFAWALEQLLNRALEGTLELGAPALEVVAAAIAVLPRMVAALEGDDTAATGVPEAAAVAGRADALRAQTSATDTDIYRLFRDDAHSRLTLVANWLAGQPADAAVEPEIVRAFHTLRGSAALAHATAVQQVAEATEAWLDVVSGGERLDAEDLTLLGEICEALQQWAAEATPIAADVGQALAQRVEARRGARIARSAPHEEVESAYALQTLDALQAVAGDVDAWQAQREAGRGAALGGRLTRIGSEAADHGSVALAQVLRAVGERLAAVEGAPPEALFPALADVFEQLYQRLDGLQAGEAEPDPAPLLDQIEGLPVVDRGEQAEPGEARSAPAPEPAPEDVAVVSPEAGTQPESAPGDADDEESAPEATVADVPEGVDDVAQGASPPLPVETAPAPSPQVSGPAPDAEAVAEAPSSAGDELLSEGIDAAASDVPASRPAVAEAPESVPEPVTGPGEAQPPVSQEADVVPAPTWAEPVRQRGEPTLQPQGEPESAANAGRNEAISADVPAAPEHPEDVLLPATSNVDEVEPPPEPPVDFPADEVESAASAGGGLESPEIPSVAPALPAEPSNSAATPGALAADDAGARNAPSTAEAATTPPAGAETGAAAPAAPPPEEFAELDPELIEVFIPEAGELLDTLDAALERWQAGNDSAANARRALHTLKGGARVVGLNAMGDGAHALETRVEAAIKGDAWDAATAKDLRAQADRLHAMYDALREGKDATGAKAGETARATESPWRGELDWLPDDERAPEVVTQREYIRVPVETLDHMLGETGVVGTQRARLVEHNAGLRGQLAELARTVDRVRSQLRMLATETDAQIAARGMPSDSNDTPSPDRYAAEFDPLEMDRYSRMQELARSLAESADDLDSLHTSMEQGLGEADLLLGQQAHTATGVQQGLMDMLLVPFSRQQSRLERVVRQAAADTGHDAVLRVEGADTELDRNVLERIVGPLEHLLRNAVVHGIEAPAVRRAAGKPVPGNVELRLQRESGQVVVEVADDGRGLDFDAIRRKALERGLLAPDAKPSDDELGRMIFEPGFSTAAKLTKDAGRGVGLDVVTASVRQLGGTLELRAQRGSAAHFVLRLPLSAAVSQALLVRVGSERYALPLIGIAGVTRMSNAELTDSLAAGGAPIHYGDGDYDVRYLGDFLGVARPTQLEGRSVIAILVRAGETLAGKSRRVGLIVDELLGTREILAKATGPQLESIQGIVGATTLPEGGIALTLDVSAVVSRRGRVTSAVAPPALPPQRGTVMVVDDSITIRRIAERLLRRNGYRVVTARDGIDAMDVL
ncbi:MAG TPA: Hpt domain-containing protein [Nevskiaceae bacterium]